MKNQSVTKFDERVPSIFEDLFKPWNELFDNRFFKREMNIPAVNIVENKDHYQLSLSAPGLKKADFKIDLDDDILTISSEKQNEWQENENERYTRREFSYQSFQRTFQLPKDVVDEDKIQAKYENGLLHLTIPKKEHAKQRPPRMIEIA